MLTLEAVSREELERQAHERYTEALGIAGPEQDSGTVRTLNARAAVALDAPSYLPFRGRVYRVEPISYRHGLTLYELLDRYHQMPMGDVDGQRRVLDRLVSLYREMATFVGWRRWVRWLLPNPFRNASDREIIALADFFWTRRTGHPFLVWAQRAAALARSTGSTASTSFRRRTGGSPSRGATTSTG